MSDHRDIPIAAIAEAMAVAMAPPLPVLGDAEAWPAPDAIAAWLAHDLAGHAPFAIASFFARDPKEVAHRLAVMKARLFEDTDLALVVAGLRAALIAIHDRGLLGRLIPAQPETIHGA